MAVQLPKVGEVFLGRYAVERIVGFGGYGRIYQARQTDLGRSVALKIIAPPDTGDDQESSSSNNFAERFSREAIAISQLSDPHTVTMYDHGEHDGLLYMVLEYIDGKTLKEALIDGPMPPERVVAILAQVLQSLAEAHASGLIHRDIKPSNIMVFTRMAKVDCVKVLDFGLAKSVRGEQLISEENLTAADTLVGTPRYMSPEQVRHEDVTPATDLYSLGLVAVEMLTGEPVIKEKTAMSIVARHVSEKEYDLSHIDAPDGLKAVVAKMLAKAPAARFQSADENLDALAGWQDAPAAQRRSLVPIAAVAASLLLLTIIIAMAWPDAEPPRPVVEAAPPQKVEPVVAKVAPKKKIAEVADEQPEAPNLRPMYEAVVGAKVRVGLAQGNSLRASEDYVPPRKKSRQQKKRKDRDNGRDLKIFEP